MLIKKTAFLKEILEDTEVLCLFGFAFSLLKDELDSWLDSPLKSVIFFHENEEEISEALQSKIHWVFCSEQESDFSYFKELTQEKVFQKFQYEISPHLEKEKKLWIEKVCNRCLLIEWHNHLEASEAQDFGVKALRNASMNSQKKTSLEGFYRIKNAFKGVPAFICGAGPSLKEEVVHLKESSDKGILFAGGAALGSLTKLSVPVHIGAGVDPDPSYARSLIQGSFESPFFYQNRFSNTLLNTVQGSLFQVPSSPGFAMEKWMEEDSEFDGGTTVSTFCASLAIHLGCNPIIFVGVDLSCLDERTKYFEGESKEEFSWNGVFYEEKMTQKDWVIAAKWIEDLVENHQETRFYTLSQKGLSLKGVCKISWAQCLEKELNRSYDVQGILHFVRSMGSVSESSWKERLSIVLKIQISFERSLQIVDELIDLFQQQYPEDPTSKGIFILQLFTLYEEIVYLNLLEPLWRVWRFPVERNFSDACVKQLNQLLFFKKVIQEHLLQGDVCK